jgi:hypothetical protein
VDLPAPLIGEGLAVDYQGESILTDNFKRLACEDAARESSSGISC